MANYQSELQKLVDGFVSQLSEIWRRQAIDSLTGMGGGRGQSSRSSGGELSLGRGRGRGAKRTADELENLADAFVEFVGKNPGLRIEQINKQLGTTTKDLALPIRKLLEDGVVKAKGKKRSTAYFPGEGQRKKKGKN
ncbi:MAG: hypothetical protein M4D80_01385 [Myxococcota bacterium]|nr:hypothetical protein [Deltaproteobacteria bacterium]MDQ3333809.1 hypothetical protein [Myxococcota bacterium]